MTTLEQARSAIATAVNNLAATWVTYTLEVEWDNRNTINFATQTNPYLCVEIMLIDGTQAGLTATQRVFGSLILTARVRKGQGTSSANTLLQHFYPSLQMSDTMFPVRTHAARIVSAGIVNDWAGQSAVIPFWYDN